MARLQSGIGVEQHKHTSLRTKAGHYRRMAMALQCGTVAHEAFPKYVPRGKPPDWYLTRAEQYEQQSSTAGEMADVLRDMEHRNSLDALSAGDAWAKLVGTYGLHGDERNGTLSEIPPEHCTWSPTGWLQTIASFVGMMCDELPHLTPKLSLAQRLEAAAYLRASIEGAITLLQHG